MSRKDLQRKYLHEKVNPLVEKMVTELLINMPDDTIGFMRKWLDTKAADPNFSKSPTKIPKDDSSQGSEEEDEGEHIKELPTKEELMAQNKHKNSRTSVSAEVYGKFNQKSAFKPKVIPKNAEQKQRIRTRLSQAFMFSALDENEQNVVIDAMEEKTVQSGEYVIKQGEKGDHLYVVDSGKLACTKLFPGKTEPTFLKNYEPGESFGELALLYNAPRAATIQAAEKCVLFALDRETFNFIVKDAAVRKREEYEGFLASIELLSNMDGYERSKIADAVKRVKIPHGSYVVKEGEKGDTFYFIEEGEAYATKTTKQGIRAGILSPNLVGEEPKEVCQYKPGSYFGELALLYDVPRQASVIAKTDLKLVTLDRMSFKRLLGPLEHILQRNSETYKNYEKLIH